MKLSKVKALITGGSSGIGMELAVQLMDKGADVAICGRDSERLGAAAKETGATAIQADVSKFEDCERAFSETLDAFGDCNVLVNNAGWGKFGALSDLSMDEFRAILDTNLVGATQMAQVAARHFAANEYGNIVNVSSTAALKGFAGGTAYVASKAALNAASDCWRHELRKFNIRVMVINPSEVLTNFAASAGYPQEKSERKLRSQEIAHAICGMLAMDDRGFTPELTVFATNPNG